MLSLMAHPVNNEAEGLEYDHYTWHCHLHIRSYLFGSYEAIINAHSNFQRHSYCYQGRRVIIQGYLKAALSAI